MHRTRRAASHPLLQLQSAVSVFLVVSLVGWWLNLSFAKTGSSVRTEVGFLFGPSEGLWCPSSVPVRHGGRRTLLCSRRLPLPLQHGPAEAVPQTLAQASLCT